MLNKKKAMESDPVGWRNYLDERNSHRRKRYYRIKYEARERLGGKCSKCGFTDFRALQFDHIHNDGNLERMTIRNSITIYKKMAKHGAMDKYQLLCANCHMIKHSTEPQDIDMSIPFKFNEWDL